MNRSIKPLLLAALVGGCQAAPSSQTVDMRPGEISGNSESAIAGDMASRFAETIGNQQLPEVHLSASSDQSRAALATALSLWGYSVVQQPNDAKAMKAATTVAYDLTAFEDLVLARISTPNLTLTRAYRTNPGGAEPTTPLAVARDL